MTGLSCFRDITRHEKTFPAIHLLNLKKMKEGPSLVDGINSFQDKDE